MSTLRTYNLQNPDSASVNIELTSDGGAVAAGILTSVGGLNVGTGGTVITTTAGGLIGINSTSPAFPLDCDQASSVFAFRSTSGSKEIKIGANDPEVISVGAPLYLTAPSSQDLILRAGGSERLRVDSSGRVTMPYQPAFFYTGAVSLSSAWNTHNYVINTNSPQVNQGNHFSSGVFTAPVSGTYIFGSKFLSAITSASYLLMTFYKNDSAWTPGWMQEYDTAPAGNSTMIAGHMIIELSASDTVRTVFHNTYKSIYTSSAGYNYMWGYLLG